MNAALALAIQALQYILSLIAEVKSQSGLSDDEILATAEKVTGANTTTYNAIVGALKSSGAISLAPAQPQKPVGGI